MTDAEFELLLSQLDVHERHIVAWEPDAPNPNALRCVHSRHRTLAHLRACQDSWLEASIAFEQKPNVRLKMLHPWRVFEQKSYETVPWDDHLAAFRNGRKQLKAFLKTADRTKGGKINANEHTIERDRKSVV